MASDSAPTTSNRARIVPAIPLNLTKPPPSRRLATPEGSETSGQERKQGNVTADGVGEHSACKSSNVPLTPESSSATTASSEHGGGSYTNGGAGTAGLKSSKRTKNDPPLPTTSANGAPDTPPATEQSPRPPHMAISDDIFVAKPGAPSSGQDGTHRMPPTFHPSETTQSPMSSAGFSVAESQMPDAVQSSHRSRPGAMSLVFGGIAESPIASPAPYSQSGASQFPAPQSRPRSMAENVNAPPFYPVAAMPPFSASQSASAYAPQYSVPPQFSPYGPVPPWMQPMPPFQYPVSATAPPPGSQPMSPSLSQHSSTKAGQEHRDSRHETVEASHWQQYSHPSVAVVSNGAISPTIHHRAHLSRMSLPGHPISDYILSFTGNPELADCSLRINDLSRHRTFPVIPGHRLLFSRSPRLASELAKDVHEQNSNGHYIVSVSTSGRIVKEQNVNETLQFLYGAQPRPYFPPELAAMASDVALDRLDHLYGSYFFNSELQISTQNERFALGQLIRWDTIERALSLVSISRHDAYSHPELRKSAMSCSEELLTYVVDFLVFNIPKEFVFDDSVAQLANAPRLPFSRISSRSSVSNPRLSKIQFGDLQGEDASASGNNGNLVSRILLSLPLSSLSDLGTSPSLFERLGKRKVLDIVTAAVHERERRRVKALKIFKSRPQREQFLSENLYLEENIATDRDKGNNDQYLLYLFSRSVNDTDNPS